MIDYLMSGHLVDNIMIMCGENVDFLNKFPTFSPNCKPAPSFPYSKSDEIEMEI